MESVGNSCSVISQKSLPRFRYCKTFFNITPLFFNKLHKRQQRVIPLTTEIYQAMMDFNASLSSSNISEKPISNTLSITSLVKCEVQNILEELLISDQFIKKEEIFELIENCLKGKVNIIEDSNGKLTCLEESDLDYNQEFEVTAEEILEERDKNKLIVENMEILEQRVHTLEEHVSCMLQNIPKLRRIQAKRFKFNTKVLMEKLRKAMSNIEAENNMHKAQQKENTSYILKENDYKEKDEFNTYDDMYYARREYFLNLLNYKKSEDSLKLNRKPKFNPYIKPTGVVFALFGKKLKQKPMFLKANNIYNE